MLWLVSFPATAQEQLRQIPQDQSAAVIFVYHRIGEDQYPESNIRREQFESHIRELASGEYTVMPLPAIIAAFKNGEKLPENTVALTFDGGHSSVLKNAVPLLQTNNLPFTVFISTDHIDRNTPHYMSWDDVKKLDRTKDVTIGLHPASYTRLYNDPESEIARQINSARARYREALGHEPSLFAYPFGEYSAAYRSIIEKQGFSAAFGQQSGVAYGGDDLLTLPRFPMTESFGGLDRFHLTATALPLPVTDIEPKDPLLQSAMPSIGFTIDESLAGSLDKLSCFVSGQDKPDLEIVGTRRIELRLGAPLEADRARINCTLPLPTSENYEEPRWRWFGLQLLVPRQTQQNATSTLDHDGEDEEAPEPEEQADG
ncbi:MAG: polysaccharide deacetylase family protein [Rhodospirillales bacterium]|nr:polysaccharide deacetylase family protein [Rhodospirillales bacterium]MCB9995430.1 polysaccharide deacetylase family protein [Rhodospirillales bacterium]